MRHKSPRETMMTASGSNPVAYATATRRRRIALAMLLACVALPGAARAESSDAAEQRPDGAWDEAPYTAVGFPRVFYLRYHGYPKYFPLWAMARYRNLKRSNTRRVEFGM